MKPWAYRNAANQGPKPKLSTCENETAWSPEYYNSKLD